MEVYKGGKYSDTAITEIESVLTNVIILRPQPRRLFARFRRAVSPGTRVTEVLVGRVAGCARLRA